MWPVVIEVEVDINHSPEGVFDNSSAVAVWFPPRTAPIKGEGDSDESTGKNPILVR
jgi:hypothetical protein